MDTIFALASAPGKAGVSVIRVSGPDAGRVAVTIAGGLPEPRHASLRRLRGADGGFVDEALVLFFPGPNSFTGEDVVEFQCHGSVAIANALLREMGHLQDVRLAEPGEFTRRALENGRLDLTQVEALSDLIEAETETQRRQALKVLSGGLSGRVSVWREKLIRAAALLEAVIDFADEDVPVDVGPEAGALISEVLAGLNEELAGLEAAERIRTGFEVAIIGPPNAGKSTLLNRLAGREAAITSDVAGTTRDVIEVRMDIGGLAVTLLDTAGLRETEDRVEAIGVARARARAEAADMRVHLLEHDEAPLVEFRSGDIRRLPKRDVADADGVSGLTGAGIEALIAEIRAVLTHRTAHAGLANRERHREMLSQGGHHLGKAESLLAGGPDLYDVTSEEVRLALRRLEGLVGHVDVEHLLDEIFSRFCLGK